VDGGRNNTGFVLAEQLRDNRYTIQEAEPAMLRYVAEVNTGTDPPYREREAKASLKSAYGKPPRQPWSDSTPGQPATSQDSPAVGRPVIPVTTEEHTVNDQAVAALVKDRDTYQRTGFLVRVSRVSSPADAAIRRPAVPRIDVLQPATLRERLAAVARFVVEHDGGDKPARPPGWCVAAVHARAHWPGVRHLEAVVDHPVLRPDGTVLSTPGYDPATGLLLEPGPNLPDVPLPEDPTRDDATAARDALMEVVSDFPFELEAHRGAWLAALLTPLARFAFHGPAPLFFAEANVRATGKGLLVHCIARIITGEDFTVATYTRDEDELRKRITSLALAGDRLVLFDNVADRFGGAVLDAALTATAWDDRVLGSNRTVKAPLHVTWYGTGNNVCYGGDTGRRVCPIRLESDEEHPERRSGFRHPDLLAWVGENRGRLMGAGLTILRAYVVAGRPAQTLPAWGSYTGWSDLVRSAVVWAGLPDPWLGRRTEHADVVAQSMAVILACWQKMDENRQGLTAGEVIHRLYKVPCDPEAWQADMKEAIETLGRPDGRTLGNRLRTYRRRVFRGMYIDSIGVEHHAQRWAVFDASNLRRGGLPTPLTPLTPLFSGSDGESGESGESGVHPPGDAFEGTAEEWLAQYLKGGRQPVSMIWLAAGQAGFKKEAIDQATYALQVCQNTEVMDKEAYWFLPGVRVPGD
jgi:hypothetical protein